jgi:hypothetical protein
MTRKALPLEQLEALAVGAADEASNAAGSARAGAQPCRGYRWPQEEGSMMTPVESNMGSNPQRQPTAEPFTYWREADGYVLGYLNAYPDHWTQGEDLDDLKAQLLDLYHEFSKDDLPGIRKVDELVVA